MQVSEARRRLERILEADHAQAPGKDQDGEPSWDTGRVVVYSLPTNVHETTAGSIVRRIISQVQRIGNNFDLSETLVLRASPTYDLGDRCQEPDQSLTPFGRRRQACPNLVVDIAYRNESLQDLREKLDRWMRPNTAVQVAIGVKVFECGARRLAILRERDGNTQEIEFGAGRSHPSPLTLPLQALYHVDLIPPLLDGHEHERIVIDLVALRALIADAIGHE